MNRLIITDVETDGNTHRVLCRMEDRRLIEAEVLADRTRDEVRIGDIYAGRIEKIIEQIRAAFVKIRPDLSVYLPLESAVDPVFVKRLRPGTLSQNDEILVQIEKEAQKGKPAAATANLSVTGRCFVLTTQNRRLGFSSKLSKRKKERLRGLVESWSLPYGMIVRTNAGAASEEDLRREYDHLYHELEDIVKHAPSRQCYSCVRKAESPLFTRLRGTYAGELDEIVTDRDEEYEAVLAYTGRYADFAQTKVIRNRDEWTLSAQYGLHTQIQNACRRKVWLKSGGFLLIDPTAALTVIDVNTGKSRPKKSRRDYHLSTNLEAAEEILYQIRLRNLSGIILVDFINLERDEDYELLMKTLRELAAKDPVPVQVIDRTALGLVEMTRKKTAKPLAGQLQCKDL